MLLLLTFNTEISFDIIKLYNRRISKAKIKNKSFVNKLQENIIVEGEKYECMYKKTTI